uniref:Timeless N-terminal domain-containing protein n=1 Tax=Terrapene triunguis TaxID=2587831 RepID=A0A674JAZ8_9SAUR
MLSQQDPEQLAATGQARPAKEQAADVRDLEVLRQRELAERKSRAFQRGSRHSRFGGSYVVQGLKSIGDRDLVFHKGLHNVGAFCPRLAGLTGGRGALCMFGGGGGGGGLSLGS